MILCEYESLEESLDLHPSVEESRVQQQREVYKIGIATIITLQDYPMEGMWLKFR